MNAVFQQLYMQPGLPEVNMLSLCCLPSVVTRGHLLFESRLSEWLNDDVCFKAFLSIEDDTDQPEESVFYQVQSLFGHLMESKLQYYVPENFWKVMDSIVLTGNHRCSDCNALNPWTSRCCCTSVGLKSLSCNLNMNLRSEQKHVSLSHWENWTARWWFSMLCCTLCLQGLNNTNTQQ